MRSSRWEGQRAIWNIVPLGLDHWKSIRLDHANERGLASTRNLWKGNQPERQHALTRHRDPVPGRHHISSGARRGLHSLYDQDAGPRRRIANANPNRDAQIYRDPGSKASRNRDAKADSNACPQTSRDRDAKADSNAYSQAS